MIKRLQSCRQEKACKFSGIIPKIREEMCECTLICCENFSMHVCWLANAHFYVGLPSVTLATKVSSCTRFLRCVHQAAHCTTIEMCLFYQECCCPFHITDSIVTLFQGVRIAFRVFFFLSDCVSPTFNRNKKCCCNHYEIVSVIKIETSKVNRSGRKSVCSL